MADASDIITKTGSQLGDLTDLADGDKIVVVRDGVPLGTIDATTLIDAVAAGYTGEVSDLAAQISADADQVASDKSAAQTAKTGADTAKAGADTAKAGADASALTAQTYAAQAQAVISSLNDLGTIGRPTNPVTGTGTSAVTAVLLSSDTTRSREVYQVRAYNNSGSNKTINLRRFSGTVGALVKQGSDVPVVLPPGLNTIVLGTTITVQPGEYLGFQTPANAYTYLGSTAADVSAVWDNGDVSTVVSTSVQTTTQLQIGFDWRFQAVNKTDFAAVKAQASTAYSAATQANNTATALYDYGTIGHVGALAAGTGNVSANTYVFADAATTLREIYQIRAYNNTGVDKVIKLRRFGGSIGALAQNGSDVLVTIPAGSTGATPIALSTTVTLQIGERLGYYTPLGGHTYLTGGGGDSGGIYTGAGDVTSVTSTTADTTTLMEIGFDWRYQRVNSTDMRTLQNSASNTALLAAAYVNQKTVGASTTPVTGSSLSTSTFCLNDAAPADMLLYSITYYARNTTTWAAKVFSKSGSNFTQVGGDMLITPPATGLQTYTFPSPIFVAKGNYLGLHGGGTSTSNQAIGFNAAPGADNPFWGSGAGNVTSFTNAANPTTGNRFEVQFNCQYYKASTASFTVTLATSDKVGVVGDSLSEGFPSLEGKAWIHKVSAGTKHLFLNWSRSGASLADNGTQNLPQLRVGTTRFHGTLSYKDYGCTQAYVMSIGNDYNSGAGITAARYQQRMREMAETLYGLGAQKVIFGSEQLDYYGPADELLVQQGAEQNRCDFINCKAYAKVVGKQSSGSGDAGFWNGVHPGVRTNGIFGVPIERYFRARPPRSSVKFFRPRQGWTVTTTADLFYQPDDRYYSRRQRWREIRIGAWRFNSGQEKYYDELASVTGTQGAGYSDTASCEYLQLLGGASVAFTNYALMNLVLPALPPHVLSATILVDSSVGANVYVPDNYVGTLADDTPVGAWVQVAGSGGRYPVSLTVLKRAIQDGDELPVLIEKSGSFSLTSACGIELVTDGVAKVMPAPDPYADVRPTGSELLANTNFPTSGAPTGWTVTGTVTGAASPDGNVPLGGNGIVTVDNANYVQQATVTFAADNYQSRRARIYVTGRRWVPKFVSSTDTYPDSTKITSDTFDLAQLYVGVLMGGSNISFQWKAIDVGWEERMFDIFIPSGVTSLTIVIRGGTTAIQVATASLKMF